MPAQCGVGAARNYPLVANRSFVVMNAQRLGSSRSDCPSLAAYPPLGDAVTALVERDHGMLHAGADAPFWAGPLDVFGRENTPEEAEIAPKQRPWARKHAWRGRNRAQGAGETSPVLQRTEPALGAPEVSHNGRSKGSFGCHKCAGPQRSLSCPADHPQRSSGRR